MATCYNCGCSLPPGTAVSTRVLKGYKGRWRSGYVLMCAACNNNQGEHNKIVAVIVLIAMAVLGVVFVLLKTKHR